MKSEYFHYFVEGDDEKKLVNTLKNQLEVIQPGKTHKLNVIEKKIPKNILRTFKKGTTVILVFDTDTNNVEILNYNIKLLKDSNVVSNIVFVPQVKKLEHELVRSCNIRNIKELLNSRSAKDFKSDLLRVTNLDVKLKEHNFDINRFWSQQPYGKYQHINNNSSEIKK